MHVPGEPTLLASNTFVEAYDEMLFCVGNDVKSVSIAVNFCPSKFGSYG